MAASITITDGLIQSGVDLISVYDSHTITFTMTGESTGDYPKLVIDTYQFDCTFISGDTWKVDVTGILKYFLGEPILSIDVDELFIEKEIFIKAYTQGGAYISGDSEVVKLCHAYSQIGVTSLLSDIYTNGRSANVYHGGTVQFYFNGTAGTYTSSINGVTRAYNLVNGFNSVTLHISQATEVGTWTFVGTTISINLKSNSKITTHSLIWINEEGCYSSNFFRLLSTRFAPSLDNEVATYYENHNTRLGFSKKTSVNLEKELTFDCIAVDDTHYQQLAKMGQSLSVRYGGYPYYAVCDNSYSECRQNLKFTVTLIRKENVATF